MNSNKELVEDLLRKLHDNDWYQRYEAVRILGDIDAESCVQEVIERMKTDTSRDVRYKAADALGKINLEFTIPDLVEVMKNDTSVIVRFTAARALGRMQAKIALDDIRQQLKKEATPESQFWFNIAILRIEFTEKSDAVKNITTLKKMGKITSKQNDVFEDIMKRISQKK